MLGGRLFQTSVKNRHMAVPSEMLFLILKPVQGNELTSIPPEIIRKPLVFSVFQGE